ncbi:MAG: hypothetical protein NTY87_03525 [Planctomycetia bacterium]|nr:hypothetical protein [Planctomycetia bacterium]
MTEQLANAPVMVSSNECETQLDVFSKKSIERLVDALRYRGPRMKHISEENQASRVAGVNHLTDRLESFQSAALRHRKSESTKRRFFPKMRISYKQGLLVRPVHSFLRQKQQLDSLDDYGDRLHDSLAFDSGR